MNNLTHFDEQQLRSLIYADDASSEYQLAERHVEQCQYCQQRLARLVASQEETDEAIAMLRGYETTADEDPAYDVDSPSFAAASSGDTPQFTRHIPKRKKLDQRAVDFLQPAAHPEMLGRLGRYEIERVIGVGGMGVVFKAHDTELNRPVAIKALARHLAQSVAARHRFARESQAVAAVVHEHVVAIHNVDSEGETPFLVMQFVAGESLQDRVDRNGPCDAKQILRIAQQAAAGLAAAHEQGLVHRDVKPANILLENGVERVLLTDFGLARTIADASLTQSGVVAGTPQYMSPEQANGDPTDSRSDLFSLGSVMYFMATGHAPFRAESPMSVLHRICRHRHRPVWEHNPDIPDELSDIIDKLLEKKPSRRFPSAAELRNKLTSLLERTQLRQNSWRQQVRRLAAHRFVVPTAAVMALAISATIAWKAAVETSLLNSQGATSSATKPNNEFASDIQPGDGLGPAAFSDLRRAAGESTAFTTEASSVRHRLASMENQLEFFDEGFAAGWADQVLSLNQRLDQLGESPSPEVSLQQSFQGKNQ